MAKIIGGKELRARLMKLPVDLRLEASKEVKVSADRMQLEVMAGLNAAASYAPFWHGKIGMQNITGQARRNYKVKISNKGMTGRVGLTTTAARKRARYLRFFFAGTVHQPSRNVHSDVFELERVLFMVNQRKALQRVLAKLK